MSYEIQATIALHVPLSIHSIPMQASYVVASDSRSLLPVPSDSLPTPPDLPLQLQHTVQERLGGRRASGNVEVHGDDTVAASDDGV